jgi:hypothetical protein
VYGRRQCCSDERGARLLPDKVHYRRLLPSSWPAAIPRFGLLSRARWSQAMDCEKGIAPPLPKRGLEDSTGRGTIAPLQRQHCWSASRPQAHTYYHDAATSPSRPCSFTERIKFGKLASRMGEYRIGSASVGRTWFSISARRLTCGSAITSRPRRINSSKMKKCRLGLRRSRMLRMLDGRGARRSG